MALALLAVLFSVFAAFAAPPADLTVPPSPAVAIAPLLSLAVCWLVGRHFRSIPDLPEALPIVRWARLGAWFTAIGLVSVAGRWIDPTAPWARAVQGALGLMGVALSVLLFVAEPRKWAEKGANGPLPGADLRAVRLVASSANPVASVLDGLESFLGVDLRGSWTLRVIRAGFEPLAIAAVGLAWLATGLTQVQVEERAVIERLGAVVPGDPLQPGLHFHLPWPFDVVRRYPVARVNAIAVGHDPETGPGGPENVLWARAHEATEYTFLLGNGRDLVTIDANLTYRVRDLKAWLYAAADGPGVLRGLVYAAVTRRTVDRSLDEVLSENLAGFTEDVAAAVQKDADTLGLGIEVVGLTVGGMHPPVSVAQQYEAVVSAQIGRDTAILGAKADSERDLPGAAARAFTATSAAQAYAVGTVATARGAALSFQGVRASFQAEPGLFQFRRRLEAWEAGLAGKKTVILDDRIERDGGGLWLTE
jgi:regulator of protease activity HflC (stomatin/prohibitin superfamily)